jgi:hypothetical protein
VTLAVAKAAKRFEVSDGGLEKLDSAVRAGLYRQEERSGLEIASTREQSDLITKGARALLTDARAFTSHGRPIGSDEISRALNGFCERHKWVPFPFC